MANLRGRLFPAALIVGGTAAVYHTRVQDLRATPAYAAVVDNVGMAILRSIDPELAHNTSVMAARMGLAPKDASLQPPTSREADILRTRVCGIEFRSPIGLAAGFDKQAEAIEGLLDAGFGFVEVGTVTPLPQPGNPQPRMFRLPADGAVINRFGFNSDGAAVVHERLATYWARLLRDGCVPGDTLAGQPTLPGHTRPLPRGALGVNIGKNKEGDAVKDYVAGTLAFAPFADYITVNISSPNTPGLRSLQGRAQLKELLSAVVAAANSLPWGAPLDRAKTGPLDLEAPAGYTKAWLLSLRPVRPPIFVKIAPDLTASDMDDIAAVVLELGVDGVIVTNTTLARPTTLHADASVTSQAGGLSGAPLFEPSTAVLAAMHSRLRGRVPLIGVGGVGSAETAYAKFQAGASLVQVYTALAYEGPTLVPRIKSGLVEWLRADGHANVREAVGKPRPAAAAKLA
jgi:dihydroorotate dehydrogenase